MLRIIGISGSQRQASTNTALLVALSEFFPADVQYRMYNGIGNLPIFNPDMEGDQTPEPVKILARQIERADGLIIASPEYVHGIPGGLKNRYCSCTLLIAATSRLRRLATFWQHYHRAWRLGPY